METGKIVIKDKVYFKPDEVNKPVLLCKCENCIDVYNRWVKAYKTSKLLIGLDNYEIIKTWVDETNNEIEICVFTVLISSESEYHPVKINNNQPCKAKIKDNTAVIIELIEV